MDILQLTQDDMNDQNRDYDDGETLCSQSCVEHWYHTSSTEKETKKWLHIFERLQSLNSK